MCGICGYIHRQANAQILSRMNEAQQHRGPDEGGAWQGDAGPWGHVHLAMRRLSILDVEGGRQPIANEDGSLWIVFNGEIYNSPELRERLERKGHRFATRTDTECIVHLYEEYGDECVTHLQGMFAFALWDCKERRLLLARDRLGIKPLFYYERAGRLVFGSEIKSILLHPEVPREVNLEALDRYLTFLYIPGPETIFRGILHLHPGHVLAWQEGETLVRPFWEVPEYGDANGRKADRRASAEELRALLRESVRSHLLSDVPLGAFLSGGVDSSTVVALMSEVSPRRVKTFSIGFDEATHNELPYARAVAQRFGTDHHEEIVRPDAGSLLPRLVWHLDQPFADSSILPTYLVSQLARQSVKVVLSGDGGDELFAGYGWTRTQALAERARLVPGPLRRVMARLGDAAGRSGRWRGRMARLAHDASVPRAQAFARRLTCFSPAARERLYTAETKSCLNGSDAYAVLWPYLQRNGECSFQAFGNRMLHADTKLYLPDDDLFKVDRMSMACSLEARVPLLDHRVVEYAVGLPFDWKLRGTTTKFVVKEAMRASLPPEVLRQRKQGFSIPINRWMRGELNRPARRLLLEDAPRSAAWLEPASVRQLFEAHESGREDLGHHLWALLVLEVWARLYLQSVPTTAPEQTLGDLSG